MAERTSHTGNPVRVGDSSPPASSGAALGPERFAEVVHRCYGRVFMVAYAAVRDKDTADDLTQETFLRAWLKRETLRDVALVEPWIGRIVRNLARQWYRSGQTRSRLLPLISLEEVVVEPTSTNAADPRQAAEQKEAGEQLHQAVIALPDDLREAVLLHYGEGLTISDIARLTSEAPSTISRRLSRAQAQLRGLLDSSVAVPLASLRAPAGASGKMLTALAAASALPVAAQARLLQMISDTPMPPSSGADIPASHSGVSPEALTMKALAAQSGFIKVAAALLITAAAVGGGVLLTKSSGDQSQSDSSDGRPAHVAVRSQSNQRGNGLDRVKLTTLPTGQTQSKSSPGRATPEDNKPRLSPQQRIVALQNDLITTNPVTVASTADTSGTISLDLVVVNQSGLPVQGADILMPQYAIDMGSTFEANIGQPSTRQTTFTTNQKGIARVTLPDMYGDFKVAGMTAIASHPDYASTTADLKLTSVTKIVLQQGFKLDVIAVDALTSTPMGSGVTPSFFSFWTKPSWQELPNGRISITKLKDPVADIVLRYESPDGRIAISDRQQISLPVADRQPVRIALNPTYTIKGHLSANVPRPVTGMKLEYAVVPGSSPENGQTIIDVQAAEVAPDGSFSLHGIPKNKLVYVSAISGEYCSVPRYSDSGDCAPQELTMADANQDYELPMMQTAAVSLKLVDKNGQPLPGVKASLSSTICYGQSCRPWATGIHGTSDEKGTALLTGYPPLREGKVLVRVENYRIIPGGNSMLGSYLNVKLTPGETSEADLTLEPVPVAKSATSKGVRLREGETLTFPGLWRPTDSKKSASNS